MFCDLLGSGGARIYDFNGISPMRWRRAHMDFAENAFFEKNPFGFGVFLAVESHLAQPPEPVPKHLKLRRAAQGSLLGPLGSKPFRTRSGPQRPLPPRGPGLSPQSPSGAAENRRENVEKPEANNSLDCGFA